MEAENEKLRLEIERTEKNKRISSETLEELLSKTRHDLEEQIKMDSKLSQELVRLKQTNEELLVILIAVNMYVYIVFVFVILSSLD